MTGPSRSPCWWSCRERVRQRAKVVKGRERAGGENVVNRTEVYLNEMGPGEGRAMRRKAMECSAAARLMTSLTPERLPPAHILLNKISIFEQLRLESAPRNSIHTRLGFDCLLYTVCTREYSYSQTRDMAQLVWLTMRTASMSQLYRLRGSIFALNCNSDLRRNSARSSTRPTENKNSVITYICIGRIQCV